MPQKRKFFSPCSERDVRAAALKATHERLKGMDEKKQPTVGKFGEILKEESAKIRSYGEEMAKKGTCPLMAWDELKKAAEEFSKQRKPSQEG
jgi:NifU-like protein involved in Fe-S cluster formation